jgi:hypothetical protein
MRTFLLRLLFGCLFATALFATPQATSPRETMWLGTDLTLGMSEDAVVAKLAESYDLQKMEPLPAGLRATGFTSMWIVHEKGQGGKHSVVGTVAFIAGKLDSVHKDFPVNGDDVEFGRQLYFAMRDLEQEGNSRCTIETKSEEVPDFVRKVAEFHCGKKTITIDLQKFEAQAESVQLNEELNAHDN